ncbi:MAG: hypothetical protein GX297_02065 [Treponema sp.]|jgi:hypothetical protein|nr:hypothetical protein [Treponema sp.]
MNNLSAHAVTHISLGKAALSSTNVLKDGGFVFVRVLGEKAGGKMLVSFAGNVFEASTKYATNNEILKTGTSFKAQIKISNGNINLIPVKNELAEFSQIAAKDAALYASMCSALNLVQDETSLKLLQFMRENFVYFTKQELRLLQKKSKKYGNKAGKMTEIVALLKSKGIEPDDEAISKLLSILESENNSASIINKKIKSKTGTFLDIIYNNPEAALNAKKGLLTLSNHLGNQNSHWIILPFETMLKSTLWTGTLRILLDKSIHSVKKLYISAKNNEKSLIFEFFQPKHIHKAFEIRYAIMPEVSKNEVERFTDVLKDIFAAGGRSVEIVYNQELQNEYFVDSRLFIKGADERA